MDWKTFFVEIVKVSIWPLLLLIFLYLFKQQIRELTKSISKLTFGNASAEFGKERLVKEISSKKDEQGAQKEKTTGLSKEDILSIPDEDFEFMQKIAGNVKFMPSDKGEGFKYNSLVNHGYFRKENNDEYKPTEKGSEIISTLKSIYHS